MTFIEDFNKLRAFIKKETNSGLIYPKDIEIDLNLFSSNASDEDYEKVGKYWESLNPSYKWSGKDNPKIFKIELF